MPSGQISTYLTYGAERRGYGWNNVTPPPPPDAATIMGYNTNEFDTFNQTLAGRQAWWSNRAPMVRRYDSNYLSGTWSIGTGIAPEKRVCLSFKPNSPGQQYDRDDLANGAGNTVFKNFVESIPAGWHVDLCFFHEPNDDIRSWNNHEVTNTGVRKGIAHDTYTAVYDQLYPVLKSATLHTGTVVHLVANFMAYKLDVTGTGPTDPGAYFNDAWVPSHSSMDYLTFDIYGNPGQYTSATGSNTYGTATGSALGSTYPIPATRAAPMFAIIRRLGWQSKWGILEVNSPKRTWDTGEAGRARWLKDFYDMLLNPPMTPSVPPHQILLWEAPSGGNWDQAFKTSATVNALAPYITGSP